MTDATWEDASSPRIDWRMSAALENVPRGAGEVAEVTSLEQAARAWSSLDDTHRAEATLTPERPVMLDGVQFASFDGEGIAALVEQLPSTADAG